MLAVLLFIITSQFQCCCFLLIGPYLPFISSPWVQNLLMHLLYALGTYIQILTSRMSALNYPEEWKYNLRCFWPKSLMRLHIINGGICMYSLLEKSMEYT